KTVETPSIAGLVHVSSKWERHRHYGVCLETVYLHTNIHAMADDFAQCMVSSSRRAARAVTRRYDAYLRPHGVTAAQLSLLGGMRATPGATVSALAEARGFDRTTLT